LSGWRWLLFESGTPHPCRSKSGEGTRKRGANYNCTCVERPPYGTRARKKIRQETLASAKGRVTPFIIAIVGLVLGFLLNMFYLHLQAAKQFAVLALVSLAGSYAIWFLGALVFHTFRVPRLLDAESGRLIDEMESRAKNAETAVAKLTDQKTERQRPHNLFGSLMQAGVDLSDDLAAGTVNGLAAWDARLQMWLISVRDTISGEGFASEAVAFKRAGEDAEPMKGVVDFRNEREWRCRVLKQHQKKLEEIVQRRFS
jgi:hypothetical protein